MIAIAENERQRAAEMSQTLIRNTIAIELIRPDDIGMIESCRMSTV